MSNPLLATALRHLTRKATHPNTLLYQVQLEKAKRDVEKKGSLIGDGKEGAVLLGDPKGEKQVEKEDGDKGEGEDRKDDSEKGGGRGKTA
jgi:hypothetical protein